MIAALLVLLAGQAAPVAAAALPDRELAEQRGGFRLPSGIDVALTVQTQTAVNGAVVLRTVFRADQGAPSFTVYAPKPGTIVAAGAEASPTASTSGTPSVSYDPRNGIQVTPGVGVPAITVSTGTVATAAAAAGLQAIDAGGAGVATDAGQVTAGKTAALDSARLQAADLTITHFAGNAFGSAIANSANGRAIDTQTTVSIDLSNAGPDVIGSAMLRVADLGSAVTAMRVQ